jgi:hypothetical protein
MNEIAALTALTARSSGHLYRSHIDRSKGTDQEGKSDQEVGSNQPGVSEKYARPPRPTTHRSTNLHCTHYICNSIMALLSQFNGEQRAS